MPSYPVFSGLRCVRHDLVFPCACVLVCPVQGVAGSPHRCLPQLLSTLSFETKSQPGAHRFRETAWAAGSRNSPVSTSSVLRLQIPTRCWESQLRPSCLYGEHFSSRVMYPALWCFDILASNFLLQGRGSSIPHSPGYYIAFICAPKRKLRLTLSQPEQLRVPSGSLLTVQLWLSSFLFEVF